MQNDNELIESRFREVLESMPDGIVMVNQIGHIVFVNAQAGKLFGYDPKELCGKPVELLLPAKFRGAHIGQRSRYHGQPRPRALDSGLDLFGQRKDGSEFPVEIALSPLQVEDAVFVISVIRDIGERKRFEKELQEKNTELANLNQAKDRFLASMSHELRTPLNAIIGFTGILLMKLPGPLTPDQDKQLRTVQASGKHLLALIDDLLDVARVGAGKVDLHFESFDCKALIDDVAASLRPQAESKGLELSVDAPGGEITVRSDRRALSQIVINLANNAIKFTERGRVRITVDKRPAEGKHVVEVGVHDTGVGIKPADQAKLFKAFTRVNMTNPKAPEGTGLGLHLSQKLAELLGGAITLKSEYGRGSTFTLILPER